MHRIDDELHLYRAVIVDNVKAGDDRLQVRILPWQAEVTGEDEENFIFRTLSQGDFKVPSNNTLRLA